MKKEKIVKSEQLEKSKKKTNKKAGKIALAILGVGFVTGTTVVLGMNHLMKKIFVNEEWPEEEWTTEGINEDDIN